MVLTKSNGLKLKYSNLNTYLVKNECSQMSSFYSTMGKALGRCYLNDF